MTNPRLNLLNHDTIIVSPTQLEVIRTCPAMWRWRYLYRRVAAHVDPASQGGKAFDAALNHRYTKLGGAACDPATEQEMLAIIDRAYEGVELPLEEYRTAARYKEVVVAYNQHWGMEGWEVLGVQLPFAVLLGEIEVPRGFYTAYAAMYDMHVLDLAEEQDWDWAPTTVKVVVRGLLDLFTRVGEHVMVVDTKTSKTSIDGSYENSAQMKCYMWALQELARLNPDAGLPPRVHAAVINEVIVRPPYKQEGRKPGAKDRPRNEFHRSFPSFYSQERLEEWRQDTLAWVGQALGWVARDQFMSNERHCAFHVDAAFTNYGHYGKPCPYLPVCTLPTAQRATMLSTDAYMDYGEGPLGAAAGETAPQEATV